jgi:hypothetical protein
LRAGIGALFPGLVGDLSASLGLGLAIGLFAPLADGLVRRLLRVRLDLVLSDGRLLFRGRSPRGRPCLVSRLCRPRADRLARMIGDWYRREIEKPPNEVPTI